MPKTRLTGNDSHSLLDVACLLYSTQKSIYIY